MEIKKKKSLSDIFEEIAQPDEDGYSRPIPVNELKNINEGFALGNGGSWCRDDGPLGKKYNIKRIKENGKIIAVKLDGFNKSPKERFINTKIKVEIRNMRCVILDVGTNIECDHKNGKYNDRDMEDTQKQKTTDFQPLSKSVNVAKRQHCKECQETDRRYDARRLGYKEAYIKGDESSKNCVGCYWHDPPLFNKIISKDFNKQL